VITIDIIYSKHALEKIDRYGLDLDEVEKLVKQGMKWKEQHCNKWHATMAGLECVFVKDGETVFVITVYSEGK